MYGPIARQWEETVVYVTTSDCSLLQPQQSITIPYQYTTETDTRITGFNNHK